MVWQQNPVNLSRHWLILLLAAGHLAGASVTGLGQEQQVRTAARHPVPAAALEGAPPDPDMVLISRDVAAVLKRGFPRTVADLRLIEEQVSRVLRKVVPATVGIQIGPSAGSGVIISPDGLVLTAGHVSGEPGRDAIFIMPDGRRLRGKTLGINRRIDSGLMQIVGKGPWPYVDMAVGNDFEAGQWVVATGHPGGFSRDRTPPVRLGRILYANDKVICTDCTLVGGDSGGPLFNMRAEVIGIHSRIGRSLTSNFHVPIETYHETWDRLAASEVWGGRLPTDDLGEVRPYLGMHVDGRGDGIRVSQVNPNSPAARAGILRDDVILKIAGIDVASRDDLISELGGTEPGQRIDLEVKRGEEVVTLKIVVGGVARPLPGSPDYESRDSDSRRRRPDRERREPREEEEPRPQASPSESGQPDPVEPNPEENPRSDSAEDAAPQGHTPADGSERDGSESPAESPDPATAADPSARADRVAAFGVELDPVAVRCVISHVRPGTGADLAGLRAGDVIVAVSGRETPNEAALSEVLSGTLAKGSELSILRSGRQVALAVR